jgi:processive 1,2-diacylglycerol beta-glucosyltransferase
MEPQAIVETIDSLDAFPAWIKNNYVGSYLFMIHRFPFLWGISYAISDSRLLNPVICICRRIFNGIFGRRLVKYILDNKPDVIYSTHFLSPEILSDLKRRKLLTAKTITVVTDFLVHRFWVFNEIDRYAVAMEITKKELVRLGIPESKIDVTGIPIDQIFSSVEDRNSLCVKHEIRSDLKTILFSSGGSGAGPVEDTVKSLCECNPDLQILVVCGKNKELYDRMKIAAKENPLIIAFGFVDFMHELMDCSDAIVGKAGGLTLSEALAKLKPFFILSPVPGQESKNAEYLMKLGAGFWIRDMKDLNKSLKDFMSDEQKMKDTTEAIKKISKPMSAKAVAEVGFLLSEIQD